MGFPLWLHLLQLFPFVLLIMIGLSVGGVVERLHFRRLREREAALRHILVINLKGLPDGCSDQPFGLVTGEVVIATDYFKTFAAGIRKILGGELRTYQTLLERARREALVRMLEAAHRLGANRVINVRFATSGIGSQRRKRPAAMVEMYAYGTALYVPDKP